MGIYIEFLPKSIGFKEIVKIKKRTAFLIISVFLLIIVINISVMALLSFRNLRKKEKTVELKEE